MFANESDLMHFLFAGVLKAVSERGAGLGLVMALTCVCAFVLNRAAPRIGLIDLPGGRKRHVAPVPLTGGLAVVSAVWLSNSFYGDEYLRDIDLNVLALLTIVAAIHAFDDHSGLSARQRLILDAVVGFTFIIVTGIKIKLVGSIGESEILLGPLAIPVTIFAYLALTNAYNMIDGLDGLAISQFLISILGIGAWHIKHAPSSGFEPLSAAIIPAAIAALVCNLGLLGPRFRCFLGDSGSRFLGFFLVFALIKEGAPALSAVKGAYFLALPALDLCAVIIERRRAGQALMRADRRHFHHLLVDAGVTRHGTVGVMGLISVAFIAVLTFQNGAGFGDLQIGVTFVGLGILYLVGRRDLASSLARVPMLGRVLQPAE